MKMDKFDIIGIIISIVLIIIGTLMISIWLICAFDYWFTKAGLIL